jgi:uncharacterized protein YjiS (DUF1127 family)
MSCKTIEISLPVQPIEAEPNWPFPRWLDWLLTLPSHVHYLYKRQRGRRELLDLDQRLLDDIGLTREQADEVAKRPFWR